MKRLGWEVPLAVIALALLACVGCCASIDTRRSAAQDALGAWRVYRQATVPHPDYPPDQAAEVNRLADDLQRALARLAEEEGASD